MLLKYNVYIVFKLKLIQITSIYIYKNIIDEYLINNNNTLTLNQFEIN